MPKKRKRSGKKRTHLKGVHKVPRSRYIDAKKNRKTRKSEKMQRDFLIQVTAQRNSPTYRSWITAQNQGGGLMSLRTYRRALRRARVRQLYTTRKP